MQILDQNSLDYHPHYTYVKMRYVVIDIVFDFLISTSTGRDSSPWMKKVE